MNKPRQVCSITRHVEDEAKKHTHSTKPSHSIEWYGGYINYFPPFSIFYSSFTALLISVCEYKTYASYENGLAVPLKRNKKNWRDWSFLIIFLLVSLSLHLPFFYGLVYLFRKKGKLGREKRTFYDFHLTLKLLICSDYEAMTKRSSIGTLSSPQRGILL